MTKISAGFSTFVYKKAIPYLFYGVAAIAFPFLIYTGEYKEEPILLVGTLLMPVLTYFVMKAMVGDLVDEVYDCGNYLLVRHRGKQEKVMLANVMNVNASWRNRIFRITLKLVTPGKFGAEIAFSPTDVFTLNPLAKNQVAEDLIRRVEKASLERAV